MLAEQLNAKGGIEGVPVKLHFVDEGTGLETLMTEYRRLAEDVGVDVMFGSISSGVCNKIAPLAEDLEVLNFMWDCGTQRILKMINISMSSAHRPMPLRKYWHRLPIC